MASHDRVPTGTAYAAPAWLPGGDLQTLYAVWLGRALRKPFSRERWTTPDGDFIDVDWDQAAQAATCTPLLVMFHGLEGGSRSHYASAFAGAARRLGWRFAVAHFRGCSGEPNQLPRAYHSGDSQEIQWILRRFRASCPDAPLFAVGVSLGGNALLKWLGEDADAPEILDGAAAISAPLDLMVAGEALGKGFNRFYTEVFLATLKQKGRQKLAAFPGLFDGEAMSRAKSLRDFDNIVTAPLHGFRDTDDYWTRASSKPLLAKIRLPTLVVNARNDPFLPAHALPRRDEVSPQVSLEFPLHGGHVGFVTGPFPGHLDWLPDRVGAFLSATLSGRPG
jgi:predicted alpha/beta-fold hydrolase